MNCALESVSSLPVHECIEQCAVHGVELQVHLVTVEPPIPVPPCDSVQLRFSRAPDACGDGAHEDHGSCTDKVTARQPRDKVEHPSPRVHHCIIEDQASCAACNDYKFAQQQFLCARSTMQGRVKSKAESSAGERVLLNV